MRIGFAGLGRMGAVMAPRLLDAGFELSVWNRTATKRAALVEKGAKPAATPADLVQASDIVVSMLGDDVSVQRFFTAKDGCLSADIKGTLFVDMTTVRPATSKAVAALVADKGGSFADAPVSGTVAPARDGKLLALIGGADADVARAMPILEKLCRRIVHAGPVGSGALLKLVVNLPLAVYWQALAEALALGEQGGLDTKMMIDTIADSSAALAVLKLKTPAILGQAGEVAFDVASMQKDVLAMIETASSLGVPVPSANAALTTYAAAAGTGLAHEDSVAIVRFLADKMTRKTL